MEQIQEPLLLSSLKSEEQFIKEEFDKFADVDYKKIFYNHPTQIKNINNNYKFKEIENMENTNSGAGKRKNSTEKRKSSENDMQLLNKKRKQSEGLSELRTELIER